MLIPAYCNNSYINFEDLNMSLICGPTYTPLFLPVSILHISVLNTLSNLIFCHSYWIKSNSIETSSKRNLYLHYWLHKLFLLSGYPSFLLERHPYQATPKVTPHLKIPPVGMPKWSVLSLPIQQCGCTAGSCSLHFSVFRTLKTRRKSH